MNHGKDFPTRWLAYSTSPHGQESRHLRLEDAKERKKGQCRFKPPVVFTATRAREVLLDKWIQSSRRVEDTHLACNTKGGLLGVQQARHPPVPAGRQESAWAVHPFQTLAGPEDVRDFRLKNGKSGLSQTERHPGRGWKYADSHSSSSPAEVNVRISRCHRDREK
jgi:hypothetical protein